MKLNTYVLVDRLREYTIEARIHPDTDEVFSSPRLIRSAKDISLSNVYVGADHDFLDRINDRNLVFAVYSGEKGIDEIGLYRGTNVLHVNLDCFEVFSLIQQLFDEFNEWDERLTEAVQRQESIQTIADIGAEVFSNPIAVFDSSIYCMAVGGKLVGMTNDNPIWNSVLSSGNARKSNMHENIRRMLGGEYGTKEETIYLKGVSDTLHQPFDILMHFIYSGEKRLGNVGMTEINHPIEKGEVLLCERFCQHLKHWMLNSEEILPSDEPAKQLIVTLLSGTALPAHIQKRGTDWLEKDFSHYYVFCITYPEALAKTDGASFSRLQNIEKTISAGKGSKNFTVVYKGCVLYFFTQTDEAMLRKECLRIQEVLGTSDGTAPDDLMLGVSNPGNSLKNLHAAYKQAKAAAITGNLLNRKQEFHFFSDYALDYFCTEFLKQNNKVDFCSALVQKLYQHDLEKGSDYVHTLKAYYENKCNISHAAKALSMHRNTLVYRLEQITDLLGYSEIRQLDDENITYHLISCALVER